MKDADKLKLMLLAWNYQNSNAGMIDVLCLIIFLKFLSFIFKFHSIVVTESTNFSNWNLI